LGNRLARERKKARAAESLHFKAMLFAELGSSGNVEYDCYMEQHGSAGYNPQRNAPQMTADACLNQGRTQGYTC
jgi:hypothetical protein